MGAKQQPPSAFGQLGVSLWRSPGGAGGRISLREPLPTGMEEHGNGVPQRRAHLPGCRIRSGIRAVFPRSRGSAWRAGPGPGRCSIDGFQSSTACVWRWSNQWAVDSCSARNLVMGGSSWTRFRGPCGRPNPFDHRAGAAGQPARDAPRRGGTPAARQMPPMSSPTGRGSPLVTTRACPRAWSMRSSPRTIASAALSM